MNECVFQIFFAFLLAFSRAIAEVGAVSMVGGAIAWKTNVMTTSIMEYTNKGDMPRAMGLGIILMTIALIVNIVTHAVEKKVAYVPGTYFCVNGGRKNTLRLNFSNSTPSLSTRPNTVKNLS